MKNMLSDIASVPSCSMSSAYLSLHESSPLKKKRKLCFDALSAIHNEIYKLDYARDHFVLVRGEGAFAAPPGITLTQAFASFADGWVHPEDQQAATTFYSLEHIHASLRDTSKLFLSTEFRSRDTQGNYHWCFSTLFPLSSSINPMGHDRFLNFFLKIHDRKQANELHQYIAKQFLNDERHQAIMRQTETLYFEWRKKTKQQYLSPEIACLFAGEYDGRPLLSMWLDYFVVHPEDREKLREFKKQILVYIECPLPIIIRLRKRNNEYLWCRVAVSFIAQHGTDPRIVGTINDVNNETQATYSLHHRRKYDPLTGIYNMETFYEQAAQIMSANAEKKYMIMRLDLHRFKLINDFFGIEEGNRLLQHIASLIRKNQGENAICGRISADIFCVCLPARRRAMAFFNELKKALENYPLPHKLELYAGICLVKDYRTPVHLLCDWAGMALRTVKGNYFRSYAFYNRRFRDHILTEKAIESEMGEALADGQFQMYLQPKVDIPTGIIVGAEALSRWQHPQKGLIPPGEFIPLFERNGFVSKLDSYIWQQACAALRTWLDKGYRPSPISVNISRTHFHDKNLCKNLLALVEEYAIPPSLLELELTESAYLDNEQFIFEVIAELQSHGFHFSMDDFGTGYSSLSTLKNLPLNTVKIDHAFLKEGLGSQRGRIIIRHTIAMAQEMRIHVLAEGVENVEHAAYLLHSGCRIAQGYYYARPMPLSEFEKLAFGHMPQFPVHPTIQGITEETAQ